MITKQDALRIARLARLTVKGPKRMLKAYQCGAFNGFEYASILIDSIRKDKNVILVAKNFSIAPKGSMEWTLGKALTWALEGRKKEKKVRQYLRNRDAKRYENWLKTKANKPDEKKESYYGPHRYNHYDY